jgi:hypothetical protein
MAAGRFGSGGRRYALAVRPLTRPRATTVFSAEGAVVRAILEAPGLTPGGAVAMMTLYPGENRK